MATEPRIEYFEDEAGAWRWHVQAANGEVVATGEGHRDRTDAERAALTALQTFREAAANEGDTA